MKYLLFILCLTAIAGCGKAPSTAQIAKITNKNTAQICGEFFSVQNGQVQILQNSEWIAVPNGDYENNGCAYTVIDGQIKTES